MRFLLTPWGLILQALALIHFLRRRPDSYAGPLAVGIGYEPEQAQALGELRAKLPPEDVLPPPGLPPPPPGPPPPRPPDAWLNSRTDRDRDRGAATAPGERNRGRG